MDASSRNLLGLISEINVRFLVPVYQRPYSWEKDQCLQLWEDILTTAHGNDESHFTGSIVTIRDGVPAASGVRKLLLIDGQQRVTTFMLILLALARYSLKHPKEKLDFSRDEIVYSGFLTNHFRSGEDHYKLTLSKGDRDPYIQLVDSVERGTVINLNSDTLSDSVRLRENLDLFDNLLESSGDANDIWRGLRHLEVVNIELTPGRDRPQLIFESMNSTGKDLSTADLVRNYVLMDYPVDHQDEYYRTLWAPIEDVLSADKNVSYEDAFDNFLQLYLTATCAPRSFAHADLYAEFKRYIVSRRYNENNRMRNFALKFKSFAEHYAALCLGRSNAGDSDFAAELACIHALGAEAAYPLVVALLDVHDRHGCSTAELKGMLRALESYLVRRSACDRDRSLLPKFFSSLIARLDAVFERGGDYAAAFYAMLRNEDDGRLAFPSDGEFYHALMTRDAFYWKGNKYVLARLELETRARQGHSYASSEFEQELSDLLEGSVEHIGLFHGSTNASYVTNANAGNVSRGGGLTAADWFNRLGNLALSWADFDLQDGDFAHKKQRLLEVPAGKQEIQLNADIARLDAWDARAAEDRGHMLARAAQDLWPLCNADSAAQEEYRPRHRNDAGQTTFMDLFDAGLVKPGDELVSANPSYPGRATVLFDGSLMLSTGEHFDDPQLAYRRLLLNLGIHSGEQNGWLEWRRGEGGPLLDELREALE